MIYDFDTLPDRQVTESFKWHAYPQDVLPMFVADMDFVSPQPVIDALLHRVSATVTGGAMGVVIDARGRPLNLPSDPVRRRELIKKWYHTVGG